MATPRIHPLNPLRSGDVDKQACMAQRGLALLGYYDGELDGKFGPVSTASAKQLQADNGLDQDGVIGRASWPFLIDVLNANRGDTVEPDPVVTDPRAREPFVRAMTIINAPDLITRSEAQKWVDLWNKINDNWFADDWQPVEASLGSWDEFDPDVYFPHVLNDGPDGVLGANGWHSGNINRGDDDWDPFALTDVRNSREPWETFIHECGEVGSDFLVNKTTFYRPGQFAFMEAFDQFIASHKAEVNGYSVPMWTTEHWYGNGGEAPWKYCSSHHFGLPPLVSEAYELPPFGYVPVWNTATNRMSIVSADRAPAQVHSMDRRARICKFVHDECGEPLAA